MLGRNMSLNAGIAGVILLLIIICVTQLLGRFVITYQLTEASLIISFFNKVTLHNIKYDNIIEIKLLTFAESFSPWAGWHFVNRIFYDNALFIKKRGFSLFCRIVITPDNPDHFFSEIARRLTASPPAYQ
jgi:hypothetical protein